MMTSSPGGGSVGETPHSPEVEEQVVSWGWSQLWVATLLGLLFF